MNIKPQLSAATAALVWIASLATASAPCPQCGCCECRKCCRLVCEMKEVVKTTYCCKCEDFCVLGKSTRSNCDCNCGHCPECRSFSWIPTAAYVRTRHLPEKQETKVQKPTYRFVVEYICPECGCAAPCASSGSDGYKDVTPRPSTTTTAK
jgi:hypothetical protein